jgi:rhodanese-related sulfurtransferase
MSLLVRGSLPRVGYWSSVLTRSERRSSPVSLEGDAADRLPEDRLIVLLCRAGIRSAEVLAVVKRSGHPSAVHLGGGTLAWVEQIDPAVATY